jgi:hypothetical protein
MEKKVSYLWNVNYFTTITEDNRRNQTLAALSRVVAKLRKFSGPFE